MPSSSRARARAMTAVPWRGVKEPKKIRRSGPARGPSSRASPAANHSRVAPTGTTIARARDLAGSVAALSSVSTTTTSATPVASPSSQDSSRSFTPPRSPRSFAVPAAETRWSSTTVVRGHRSRASRTSKWPRYGTRTASARPADRLRDRRLSQQRASRPRRRSRRVGCWRMPTRSAVPRSRGSLTSTTSKPCSARPSMRTAPRGCTLTS